VKPETAIARRAFQQVWLGATIWALTFGVTVLTTALTYVTTFPDEASRQAIARGAGADAGASILLGPINAIDTVGGYVTYKLFVFLTSIGAVWGLLIATRLLRGEEDTGRWQLTLAGGTRSARATVATAAALVAAVAIVFVGTAVGTLLAARNTDVGFGFGESLLYSSSIAIAPAVFVAVGVVTSQLGRSRRVATGLGMCVFGVAMVVRMIADSGESTKWLLWATPFGWIERMRPLTDNDPLPLVVAVMATGALLVTGAVLAARRDVGDGVFASRDVTAPRRFGLGSPLGLVVRLETPVLIAWVVGAAAAAFALGIIAKIASGSIPASLTDTLEKFGVQGAFVKQYFGVAFLLVATLVALLPASQIGAGSQEETSGRLVQLLSRPAHRGSVLAGRLALAGVAIIGTGIVAGLAAWLGARTQGVDLGLASMLGAGLNVVPTALLVLGIGGIALGLAPRAASAVVYAVVIASLLIDLLTSLIDSARWLDHVSLFHYMALAPAQPVDKVTIVTTVVVAIGLCAVATVLFARRDIETG
jgi:ABC-2 type transport system permease protein